jgi:signal peptidase II
LAETFSQASQPPQSSQPAQGNASGGKAAIPSGLAIKSPKAVVLFLLVLTMAASADLLSKHYVFESFLGNDQLPARIAGANFSQPVTTKAILQSQRTDDLFKRQVAPGVKFTVSTNPGIVFGAHWLPGWVVIATTIITILAVCAYFAGSRARDYLSHVGLALIVGGAVGNLYDRLFAVVSLGIAGIEPIRGEVRDFIDCSDLFWPYVFNIADAWLVIGVALMIIPWLRRPVKPSATRPTAK